MSLLYFLEHRLGGVIADLENDDAAFVGAMLSCIQAASRFMKTIYHTALWLSNGERDVLLESGHSCIKHFQACASYAFDLKLTRWKFQPKIHMFGEILHTLERERRAGHRSISPLAYCTQMDEDFIGHIATMSRKVAVKTVHSRTLQKYQIALASRW